MATLDTLQDSVNILTASTTTLVNEVQVKKATLDASVADAESAQTGAQSARDTASLHKLAAEAAATSATSTASALTGFDLAAIAESKAVTAVDVFVYDTSKDSDGGAWRKRTQGTSWYNETLNTATRGSRREFPSVAVIVAEDDTVTIYDGDDPALPMWMVFNASTSKVARPSSSLFALNGVLLSAGTNLAVIDYISDEIDLYGTAGFYSGVANGRTGFTNRNATIGWFNKIGDGIVDATVNDVAMTVLPDAPIDPATGLPVPTIAVATDGGVSVIKDDGTVVDITWTNTGMCGVIAFNGINQIVVSHDGTATRNRFVHVFDIPNADLSEGNGYTQGSAVLYLNSTNNASDLKLLSDHGKGLEGGTHGGINGLALFDTKEVAYVTSAYNTGWMNGDIKGAFLSDTDDTDLVSENLFTNSSFSTGDETGWTANAAHLVGTGDGSVDFSVVGQVTIPEQGGSDRSISQIAVGSKAGDTLKITRTTSAISASSSSAVRIAYGGSTTPYIGMGYPAGTYVSYVTAVNDEQRITIHVSSTNATVTITNFEVEIAEADRSGNGNGLTINGTITKTPVATGADLVAYSGFSASNYLEQPYNSDLDFGTGDFCVMGWGKTNINGTFLSRGDGVSAGSWFWKHTGGSTSPFYIHDGSAFRLSLNVALPQGDIVHFALLRRSGTVFIYGNGKLMGSSSGTYPALSMTNLTAKLRIADQQHSTYVTPAEKLALIRISATAPSAEQIAKIYNDEKPLFQENAQATLYGSSDAVTALAHDDDTDLLHVGTSAGRSVFQGLRRVDNTTTAVGTAISANNGLVVEE